MSRRYLAFVIGINAIVSLTITLLAIWLVELRRPDPEQLASIITPRPQVILASTPIPATTPTPESAAIDSSEGNSVAATAAPQQVQVGDAYTVQEGDSLSSIATRYNVSIDELLQANSLENPDFVFVGQRLFLPFGAEEIPQPTSQPSSSQSESSSTTGVSVQNEATGPRITQADGVGSLDSEVLLIVNEGNEALNLQGWSVAYDGGPTYTFSNFPIFPGGSVRLHTTTGTDSSIDLYWAQPQSVWQSQRTARLTDDQGRLVNQYTIP